MLEVEVTMEADIELIVRSRPTIVEIVEGRGYNVAGYKDIHPEEIQKLAATSSDLLRIVAPKVPDSVAGGERCIVLYWVVQPFRLRLENEIEKLFDEDNANHYNQETDDIIIIISEPYHEVFDLTALKIWNTKKARITFFHLKNIISNPAKHVLVPPHKKLNATEIASVIAETHVKTKSEFPHIKYHRDIQARVLGLVPGDIVEIKRPSETCGLYTMYRICAP